MARTVEVPLDPVLRRGDDRVAVAPSHRDEVFVDLVDCAAGCDVQCGRFGAVGGVDRFVGGEAGDDVVDGCLR